MPNQFIKLNIILLVLLVCNIFKVHAQQDAQYTQFMYNKLPQNAAYTGAKEGLSIRALYRDQWSAKKGNKIDGAPKTTTFSIHSPFKKEAFAMGFYFVNDRLGLEQKNQFNITYAYRVSLGKKVKLSLGINSGILWYKLNVQDAVIINPNDNKYRNNINVALPDVGAGLFIYHPNFYFGASVPNFIKSKLTNKGDDESNAVRVTNFVVMAGGIIPITKHIKIRPQMQYICLASRTKKMPHSLDMNLSLMLYDKVNIGAQYHATFRNHNNENRLTNPDSFNVMIEVWPTKQFMIGYSYDYTLSKLSSANSGSHEVIVGYDIPGKKNRKNNTGCFHF